MPTARLPAADLALQLAEQVPRADEMVVEDAPRDVEEVGDRRVAQRIPDGETFLLRGDDPLVPEDGQVLRDDWLSEREVVLEFLHRPAAVRQDLEDPDADGMRERAEEAGLESLELADAAVGGGVGARYHWTIIFKYCYDRNTPAPP